MKFYEVFTTLLFLCLNLLEWVFEILKGPIPNYGSSSHSHIVSTSNDTEDMKVGEREAEAIKRLTQAGQDAIPYIVRKIFENKKEGRDQQSIYWNSSLLYQLIKYSYPERSGQFMSTVILVEDVRGAPKGAFVKKVDYKEPGYARKDILEDLSCLKSKQSLEILRRFVTAFLEPPSTQNIWNLIQYAWTPGTMLAVAVGFHKSYNSAVYESHEDCYVSKLGDKDFWKKGMCLKPIRFQLDCERSNQV